MADKSDEILYGLDDKPPTPILFLLSIQHIFLMSSTLVLPVVLVLEIGGTMDDVRIVVAMTMVAAGLGTIIQATRGPGIGSGLLCPNLCGPNFFAVSMEAAWLGGLPLMRGMTIAAGLVEMVLARFFHRLAFLFPPEITGVVVLMVAISIIPLGVSKFFGVNYSNEYIDTLNLSIAVLTLLVMIGANVIKGGKLKLYSVLLGLPFGYVLSFMTGATSIDAFDQVKEAAWFGLPSFGSMMDISFSWSLLPAFIIVSICGALKTYGNLAMAESINDKNWQRPNVKRMGGGLMADACSVTASGLLGGMATDTSASNVSLSKASGATSRIIGFVAGLLFILLGFSPKLSGILAIMPMPVMGAILIFVVSFMIMAGIQIIIDSKPDAICVFVVGVSLTFGLSLQAMPELYALMPTWLRPIFSSALSFTGVLAIVLNQLLRFGQKRQL